MSKCLYCGKEIVGRRSDSKYCSTKCSSRLRCKNYYYRYHDKQKKRVLENYYKYKKTDEGLKRIRKTNYRANSKRRFSVKDRREIVAKFNNRCVYCGKSEKRMIVHHLDNVGRNSQNPNNKKENLVLCCMGCHSKIHFWHQRLNFKPDLFTFGGRH